MGNEVKRSVETINAEIHKVQFLIDKHNEHLMLLLWERCGREIDGNFYCGSCGLNLVKKPINICTRCLK